MFGHQTLAWSVSFRKDSAKMKIASRALVEPKYWFLHQMTRKIGTWA